MSISGLSSLGVAQGMSPRQLTAQARQATPPPQAVKAPAAAQSGMESEALKKTQERVTLSMAEKVRQRPSAGADVVNTQSPREQTPMARRDAIQNADEARSVAQALNARITNPVATGVFAQINDAPQRIMTLLH